MILSVRMYALVYILFFIPQECLDLGGVGTLPSSYSLLPPPSYLAAWPKTQTHSPIHQIFPHRPFGSLLRRKDFEGLA